MGLRTDMVDTIIGLLTPLVGTAANQFRCVKAVTISGLQKALMEEIPQAPFCLVAYAGKDGGFEGDEHKFAARFSVFTGAHNLISPAEKRLDADVLMGRVDDVLMGAHPFGDGNGPMEKVSEALAGYESGGIEVWEQVYRVNIWVRPS